AGDEVDQRRFSSAAVTDDGDELAALDRQIKIAQHVDLRAGATEGFFHVAEFKKGHGLHPRFVGLWFERPIPVAGGRNRQSAAKWPAGSAAGARSFRSPS